MTKVIADKKQVLSKKENKILLEILVSLEKIKFSNYIASTSNLTRHQILLNNLSYVGSLYEAIMTFDKIKGAARVTVLESKDEKLENFFKVLCSKDTRAFKETVLNKLRNKAAFHIDEVVINSYFETFSHDEVFKEVELWVKPDSGEEYSPIVESMLNWWYIECLYDGDIFDNVFKLREISDALVIVTQHLMIKWFKVKIIQE